MKKNWTVTMGAALTILLLKGRSRLLRLYVFIENPASINYEMWTNKLIRK